MSTFKVGDKITVKSKAILIEETGALENGYPNTTIAWNTEGLMDHYFGNTGTIDSVNKTYITLTMDDLLPGKEYGRYLSADMLELTTHTTEPVITNSPTPNRQFMPKTTTPVDTTVWANLLKLKTKEQLEDGVIAKLFDKYLTVPFEEFKKYINYIEKYPDILDNPSISALHLYYPKMNIEQLAFLYYYKKTNNSSSQLTANKFLKLKANKNFKQEFSDIPFTPIKRILNLVSTKDIESIWDNLIFQETLTSVSAIRSQTELKQYIKNSVICYMNNNNLNVLTDEKIEIG